MPVPHPRIAAITFGQLGTPCGVETLRGRQRQRSPDHGGDQEHRTHRAGHDRVLQQQEPGIPADQGQHQPGPEHHQHHRREQVQLPLPHRGPYDPQRGYHGGGQQGGEVIDPEQVQQ